MTRDRYVILGLGRSRSSWFTHIAHWTTSGAVPAEFHKCLSANHIRQRLDGMQPYSALIVEDGIAEVDRDLIEIARRANTATFVIANAAKTQTWLDLGAATVLPPELSPAVLLQALATHTVVIGSSKVEEAKTVIKHVEDRQGQLIAVCGPGGTGASTVAIAIAQALATNVSNSGHILLADFARNGEQGMLHDSPDIMPGVEEIVELHRHRRATTEQIREHTFNVEQRGYRLLLGQRRVGAWSALPPTAVSSTLAGLRRTFQTVVADITADFENETQSGSLDVEERNALARTAIAHADLVFAVGNAGMKGVHALVRTMRQIADNGTSPERIVPVITRLSRRSLERSEITRAIAILGAKGNPTVNRNPPVFLPHRSIEQALRDGRCLPKQLTNPLDVAIQVFGTRLHPTTTASTDLPTPITPGTLGTTFDQAPGE